MTQFKEAPGKAVSVFVKKTLNIDKMSDEDQAFIDKEQAEWESKVTELCADVVLPASAKSRQNKRKGSSFVSRVGKKSKRTTDASDTSDTYAREYPNKKKRG